MISDCRRSAGHREMMDGRKIGRIIARSREKGSTERDNRPRIAMFILDSDVWHLPRRGALRKVIAIGA